MTTTSALSIANVIHRIERAPNVRCLVAAYDAAIEGSTLSVHRKRGSEWAIWHGEYAAFSGTFAEVRAHLAADAEEILDREAADQIAAVPATPVMVQQVAQQQQACAAPTLPQIEIAKAEVARLDALCAVLRDEKKAAYSLLRECRAERIAIIADEVEGDAGIAWTNEERAEAAADEAEAALDRCLNDFREAFDWLSDEQREEWRSALKARAPAMVQQQCQQQQACAAPGPITGRPVSPPAGLPTNGWSNEEIHTAIGQLLEGVEETAVASFDERLREAASSAVSATKAWLDLHEREVAGEHVPYNVAYDARDRLQDCHRAYADTQAIVQIGDIGDGRSLWSHRDGLAVYDDGDADPFLILPRGIDRETVRLVLRTYDRAYDVGKAVGRIEIQHGLRHLLGAAAV